MAEEKKEEKLKVIDKELELANSFNKGALEELSRNQITLNYEQKQNMLFATQSLSASIKKQGIKWKDIGAESITKVLERVAIFNLNVMSVPAEAYIMIRNNKVSYFDEADKKWKKRDNYQAEFNVQGAGYEKLVRNFGVNVKRMICYEVHEGDEFVYPIYSGFDITPPKWIPKGKSSKVERVVYVVDHGDKPDGTHDWEYFFGEREDVKRNLMAHVSNNLMYDKSEADNRIKAIESMTLDEALNSDRVVSDMPDGNDSYGNPKYKTVVSPAWKSPQSREQMIVTKMRINALRRYPKAFNNKFIEDSFNETEEENDDQKIREAPELIDMTSSQEIKEELKQITSSEKVEVPDILNIQEEPKKEEVPAKKKEPLPPKQKEVKTPPMEKAKGDVEDNSWIENAKADDDFPF